MSDQLDRNNPNHKRLIIAGFTHDGGNYIPWGLPGYQTYGDMPPIGFLSRSGALAILDFGESHAARIRAEAIAECAAIADSVHAGINASHERSEAADVIAEEIREMENG